MTHKDIYTKFMIEYDKANVTSSYPSLTEYEVATVLDKAYNALIAQKITGNNVRRATFESDIKSIADLGPLVVSENINYTDDIAPSSNSVIANLPSELLYFLQAQMWYKGSTEKDYTAYTDEFNPADEETERRLPVKLVDHNTASNFLSSSYNMPWIKEPVCYIENGQVIFVYDPLNKPEVGTTDEATVLYIKHPNTFVKDLSKAAIYDNGYASYFDFNKGTKAEGEEEPTGDLTADDYNFECNSTVAEELISLAVAFALENVESQRLNSKLNMRGLEA